MALFEDAFWEKVWRNFNYVFYNPKTNELVCVKFQRWIDEGDKQMVEIHNRVGYMSRERFLKQYVFIGEMGYEEISR